MRKKLLLTAAIAFAVLIAVLAVILIAFPRHRSVDSGDAGSLYAYRFTEQRDGLLVTIADGPDGEVWTAQPVEPGVVTVTKAAAEAGETAFLLSPAGGGDARVEFTLGGAERSYQLYVDVHAAGKEIRVVGSGHQAFSGKIADEEGRYTITPVERGKYLVYMAPAVDADWAIESENGCVLCEPYDLWDGQLPARPDDDAAGEEKSGKLTLGTCFTLSCLKNEADVVYIYDRTGGQALKIELDYDEEAGLYPVSHAMVKYSGKKAASE